MARKVPTLKISANMLKMMKNTNSCVISSSMGFQNTMPNYQNCIKGIGIPINFSHWVVYGCRLLIPTSMRKQVLSQLHYSHQGTLCIKLCAYLTAAVYDIDNTVLRCRQCQDHLPSNQKEPLIHKNAPFLEVAADFYSHAGQNYLDCHTDWPCIIPMGGNATAPHLVAAIRQLFCHTGIPDIFWTDEGPQFT